MMEIGDVKGPGLMGQYQAKGIYGLCYVNTSTCFSKDAENLTTHGYVL